VCKRRRWRDSGKSLQAGNARTRNPGLEFDSKTPHIEQRKHEVILAGQICLRAPRNQVGDGLVHPYRPPPIISIIVWVFGCALVVQEVFRVVNFMLEFVFSFSSPFVMA
jgi:hypothetical protein